MRHWPIFLSACLFAAFGGGLANADLVRLTRGGEVRGTLRPGHTRDPQLTIDTLTGGVIVVDRSEVRFTTVRRIELEQYELRSRDLPHTVDAHWELAEWCRKNQLRPQRAEQLEQLLLVDPAHVAAHRALGHVQERGEWMTREQQMASRGYVQHKGKYVTPQELELLEKSAAEREAERQWYTKLIVLVRWLGGSNERQRQQAVAELREITDPAAVWGLASHMARHQQPGVRRYLVEILAGIPGVKPAAPLVELSLYDEDAGIRSAALDGLREEQYAAAVAGYVPALQHSENAVVNRAGAALGRLGDVTAAPALIDALVTQHSFQVQVPVRNAITVVNGPYGAQFSDPNLVSQYLPPDVDLALRAGQLPFGVQVISPGGSSTTWRTYRVQAQLQNVEVLTALQSLTGQDFGYDERTWKLWWAAEGQKLLASRA